MNPVDVLVEIDELIGELPNYNKLLSLLTGG